ncbi:MAG: peptidoglycan-binding domain-containing protein [Haliscomenobacter sp.]|uniref:peptidoglycan-binding domain-containing protein n=1 Tax=Haliscomenobacter sp. TaxID=2717303 RepID=UPI00299FE12B|nr:peptidoglycan-binding domain-containing protein [Haliscomenobacter sp.]MDX2068869.1 peptidoglycan-binding domain-containing protein [Haliscomenobacter sp.]
MLRIQLSLFFILLLGAAPALFAQSSNSYYTILVGTFSGNRPENYKSLEKLGFLFAKERPNQIFDVYLGGYDTALEAAKILDQVKKTGFSAAKIQQYVVRDNQSVASIQIASFDANAPVTWNKYQALSGELFVIPNEHGAKLLSGFYPTIEAAKKELPKIQAMGYADAFVRTAHPTFLHQIGGFETGTQLKEVSATAQIGPKKTNVAVSKPVQRPQPTFLPVDYQLDNPVNSNIAGLPGVNNNPNNTTNNPVYNPGNPNANNTNASVPPPSGNPNRTAPAGNGQAQFKWDTPGANTNPPNTQAKGAQVPVSYEAPNNPNNGNGNGNANTLNPNNPNPNPGTANPNNTYGNAAPGYNYNSNSGVKGANVPPANMNGNNAVQQNNQAPAPVAIYRASVKELQQALAQEGAYRSGVDGYFNAATEQAYDFFQERNRLMTRYAAAAQVKEEDTNTATSRLNNMLNHLDKDANPIASLASINHPLSKAYMAYNSFTSRGPGFETNNLMNGAIREVFSSRNVSNQISFDSKAAYAYTDLRQFMLHLYFLHAALGEEYPLPCWLNDKHPEASAEAQGLFNASSALPLPTQSCEEQAGAEQNSSKVLQLLAEDIGVDKPAEALLKQAADHRTQLLAGKVQVSAAEQTQLDAWSTELMNKLNIWAAQDPLHAELVRTFRVVFYQTQMELENHFINQGMPVPKARYMALATEHTLVSPFLQRFE